MSKAPPPPKAPEGPPSKKRNKTVWLTVADTVRLEAAVANASARLGYPLTVSTWMTRQIMLAVEDEERRAKKQRG